MSKLIIMVGNIGAGKTTLSRKLVREGCIIISKDSVRYMLGSGNYVYRPDCEPIVTEVTLQMLDTVMKRLDKSKDYTLVIDNTNMSKEIRKDYLRIAKQYGYTTEAMLLPRLSMKESVARRLNNNHGTVSKQVWEAVYIRREKVYDEPTKEEGFDIITKL